MQFEGRNIFEEIENFNPSETDQTLINSRNLDVRGINAFNKYAYGSDFSGIKFALTNNLPLSHTFSTAYLTVLDAALLCTKIFRDLDPSVIPGDDSDHFIGLRDTVKGISKPNLIFSTGLDLDLSYTLNLAIKPHKLYLATALKHINIRTLVLKESNLSETSYRHIRYAKRNIDTLNLLTLATRKFIDPTEH